MDDRYENEQLYHHGTKNMKWGVRRYQNEDGSLTPLGRIHYGVGKARKAAATGLKKTGKAIGSAAKAGVEKHKTKVAAKKESERIEALMKKPLHKLTGAELEERTKRAEAEKRLIETEDKYSHKAKSFMANFGKKFLNEAVVPAATEAGKSVLKKFIDQSLSKVLGADGDTSKFHKLVEAGGDLSGLTDDQIGSLAKRVTNINTIRQQVAQANRAGSGDNSNQSTKPESKPDKDAKPESKPGKGNKPESKPGKGNKPESKPGKGAKPESKPGKGAKPDKGNKPESKPGKDANQTSKPTENKPATTNTIKPSTNISSHDVQSAAARARVVLNDEYWERWLRIYT